MKKLILAAALGLFAPLATHSAIADSSPAMLETLDTAHVKPLDSAEETRGKYFPIYSSNNYFMSEYYFHDAQNRSYAFCMNRPKNFGCTGRFKVEKGAATGNHGPTMNFYAVQYRSYSAYGVYQYQWAKY